MKRFGILAGAIALAACSTQTGDANQAHSTSSAIVSGDADTGDPAVAAIGPRRIHCDDDLAPICSGVLVAPRVVLTAAHCFVGQRPGKPYEVFFGNDVNGTGELHGVTRIVTPGGYDGGNGGGDLALLVLDSAAAATPVAMGALTGADTGKTVKMAGFGITEDGGGIGTKRFGAGTIESIATDTFRVTPLPSMTCDGDSGGPLFLRGGSGDVLVGVTSFGDPGCTTFAVNARIDAFASFVQSVIAASPDAGADPDPADSPPKNVCSGSCATASECGAGFDCPASADGPGKCDLAGLPPGDFGDKCDKDDDCASSTCARLGSSATSCRCLTTCGITGPSFDASNTDGPGYIPQSPDSGCGCRFAGNSARSRGGFSDPAWLVAIGFFAAISVCRRRKSDA